MCRTGKDESLAPYPTNIQLEGVVSSKHWSQQMQIDDTALRSQLAVVH